jgi:hypothetical protein
MEIEMTIITALFMFSVAIVLSRASVALGFKILDLIKSRYGS